ncbi:MipA/OmpV family protein [Endozoicomonas sp. G2_2]|nr:MipA/OmpV family protein [Endozoicomonas sp. G2_2]MBO9471388.1 MipA/OmpV family protein [Endozoicomonas sp. G2_2]
MTQRLLLSLGPNIKWSSDDRNDALYGLCADEAARLGVSSYGAAGGLSSVGLDASLTYLVTEQWSVTTPAGMSQLLGDAADSPIVDDLGSATQASFAVPLGYQFCSTIYLDVFQRCYGRAGCAFARGESCWFRVLGLMAVLVVAGGAGTPARQALSELYVPVPNDWVVPASDAAVERRWWAELGGPQLDAVVSEALANNRDLRAAAARKPAWPAPSCIPSSTPALVARILSRAVPACLVPVVQEALRAGPIAVRSDSYGLSLNLSWEIDLWGPDPFEHVGCLCRPVAPRTRLGDGE